MPGAVNAAAVTVTRPPAASGPLPPRTALARPGPGVPQASQEARETHLELDPVDTAPRRARGVLREFLARWGSAHLRDPGEEIATELVSNALAASVREAPAGSEPRPVVLRLTLRDGELCIGVQDPDPTPPPRDQPLPDDDAEHGRGLFLVAELSNRWGWYPARNGGKHVWATCGAPTGLVPGDSP